MSDRVEWLGELPPSTTLADAKDWLRERLDQGANCPCCRQRAQSYRRSIHASMAAGLIRVYHCKVPGDWITIADVLTHRQLADFGKLAYWSLVSPREGTREDGSKRVGDWRVTPYGEQFVADLVTVPKYAVVYDGRLLRHEGKFVGIQDCLGKRFDYAELLSAAIQH